jgi:ABC-type multidrug transport system fused ATPase/permease subunit
MTGIVLVRTLWIALPSTGLTNVSTASLGLRFLILLLEAIELPPTGSSGERGLCPEDTSSILNRALFLWLIPILVRGYKRVLNPDDLYELVEELKPHPLSTKFDAAWKKMKSRHQRYALDLALVHTFKWQIVSTIIWRALLLALTISSPVLLSDLLQRLSNPSSQPGWGFIIAFAIVYFGSALFRGLYWREHYRTLSMLRVCLIVAITGKTVRLNRHTIGDSKLVLTLMSTEIDRVINGLKWLHEYWSNFAQAGIAMYLLKEQTSIAFIYIAPLAIVFVSAGISVVNSRFANTQQGKWIAAVQSRVGLITHMLNHMKGIRLRGLEDLVRRQVAASRNCELSEAKGFRITEMYAVVLGFLPELFGPVFALLTIVVQNEAQGTALNATVAFTTIALLNIMAQPLTISLQNLPDTVAVRGCLNRIDDYLRLAEENDIRIMRESRQGEEGPYHEMSSNTSRAVRETYEMPRVTTERALISTESVLMSARHCSIGYRQGQAILRDVNIDILHETLTMIIGPVGSGKTTLCRALLGECSMSGRMDWEISTHDIAYCEQVTFLTNASIFENITCFSDCDRAWYQAVITACALASDIAAFPDGDRTIVGSGAAGISGGQKQRVALARALYARKRVIILDDVLSGLDAHSEGHIVEHAIGPRGLARSYGAAIILATHAAKWLPIADLIISLGGDGTIEAQGRYDDIRSQVEPICMTDSLTKDRQEQLSKENHKGSQISTNDQPGEQGSLAPDANDYADPRARNKGDMAVYAYYSREAGIGLVCCLTGACAIAAMTWTLPSYWLEVWTDPNRTGSQSQYFYLAIYTTFQASTLLMILFAVYITFIKMVTRAGVALHLRILETVADAPWSVLSMMNVGSVINRFSQDIELMDIELPSALLNFQLVTLLGLAQTILIVISSPWIGLSLPLLIAILYVVQKFYLRTSRQVRLLDLEARAPLFTDFIELVQGLSTYRAFHWLSECETRASKLLEKSQEPRYLLYMIQLWLAFVLDIVVACIAVAIVAIALGMGTRSGPTGLALTQVMSLSAVIKNAVTYWTNLETCTGAINRIREFTTDAVSEHQEGESKQPPPDWPRSGKIRLEGLTASYRYDLLNKILYLFTTG